VKAGDRTWWITEINGEVQVTEISNILFPRKNGFWVGGTKRIQEGEVLEQYVWAAALGEDSKNAQPDLSNTCQSERDVRDILFVGSNYLAVREFTSATCAHYDEGTAYYVTTPEDPNLLDTAESSGLNIS
jgi:predicted pyridoxine 5'-phosphate oxidase superfamily flavin-nucleotide-binding protein